jgi:hypothetical protein
MTYDLYAYLYAQALSAWEKGLQIGMGRAGIEPATLGLKVAAARFACYRGSSRRGIVKPNRLG